MSAFVSAVSVWLHNTFEGADPQKDHRWKGSQGVLVDVMNSLMEDAKLNFSLDMGWASEESRAVYPLSSYTACCLDVIVHKTGALDTNPMHVNATCSSFRRHPICLVSAHLIQRFLMQTFASGTFGSRRKD